MPTTKDKKILVVDDEQDVRNYLTTALQDAGFQVSTASDGFEALDAVKNNKPDLISLDLVMPKHSGVKFYHDLQKDKENAKIPVLIVTGHARDDLGKVDFDTMTMQGPGVYLEKPVKSNKYITTVCKMLEIDPPKDYTADSDDPDVLRNELAMNLKDADPEALKKALEALKK